MVIRAFFIYLFFTTILLGEHLITPIPKNDTYDEQKALLGKKLFFDTRLSEDNSISCASCHNLEMGGDDNLPVAIGINGKKGTRNTPTVFNTRYHFKQFWDGRVDTLEAQAEGPIHNPVEMGTNFEEILKKLSKDKDLKKLFTALYKDEMNSKNIIDAIVEFEKALITPNARFDQYLRGDQKALSENEMKGFQNFKEYGCIGCHNGVNIGGNLFQKIGLVQNYKVQNKDVGRFDVTNKEKDKYVFKVPSLRNIELTAPYFHDGSVESLEEAVSYMVHYQIGLALDEKDIKDIVAFLKTLTGEQPEIMSVNK